MLGGIKISEPVTACTDLVTGVISIYAFLKLRSRSQQITEALFFTYYFLFIGIAVIYSAIAGHAFFHLLNDNWKIPGWLLGGFSILLIEYAIALFLLNSISENRKLKWIKLFPFIQFGIFLIFIFSDFRNFTIVRINSAIGFICFVLPISGILYFRNKLIGLKFILLAIMLSLLPAVVYFKEISIHKWFNYHDLSHVLMAICIFLLYKGVYHLFHVSNSKTTIVNIV